MQARTKLALVVAMAAGVGVVSGPARAAAPKVDARAVAVLCKGRTAEEYKRCADFCRAWPANGGCLMIRTWGGEAAAVWGTAVQGRVTLAESCRRNRVDKARCARFGLWLDSMRMLPPGWPGSGPYDHAALTRARGGWALLVRGLSLHAKGNAKSALAAVERSVEILRRKLGPADRSVALAESKLAVVLHGMGRFKEALTHAAVALATYRALLPADHGCTAEVLQTRAFIQEELGERRKALASILAAVRAAERSLTADNPKTAGMRLTAARMQRALGDAEGALDSARRALKVLPTLLGPEHPKTAIAWQRVASAAADLGDPETAVQAGERALAIDRGLFPPGHPVRTAAMGNLATWYAAAGGAAKARELYERVIAVLEKSDGPRKLRLATAEHLYGRLLRDMGQVIAAGKLFKRAYDRRLAGLGPLHPDTIAVAHDMTTLQMAFGQYEGAEKIRAWLYRESLKKRGPKHPSTARAALNFAQILEKTGRRRDAIRIATAALPGLSRDPATRILVLLELARWTIGEGDDRGALGRYRQAGRLLAAGALEGNSDELTARVLLAQGLWLLGERGGSLALRASIDRAVRRRLARGIDVAHNDLSLLYTVHDLRAARALMLEQAFAVAGRKPSRRATRSAPRGDAALEAVLLWQGMSVGAEGRWRARRRGEQGARVTPTARSVRRALAATGSSLVAYVKWEAMRRGRRGTEREAIGFDERYSAVVVRPDGGPVRVVPIGPAAEVEGAVRGWRRAIDAVASCVAKRHRPVFCKRPLAAMDAASRPLHARLWTPVVPHLPRGGRVWIAPDAMLTRVAFDALTDASGRYLAEVRELAVLPYPAAARRLAAHPRRALRAAFVAGDLNYDHAAPDADGAVLAWNTCAGGTCRRPSHHRRLLARADTVAVRGVPVCGRRAAWSRLPPTEAPEVARYLGRALHGPVLLAAGSSVIEPALRVVMPGTRVIHLATHGFFSPFKRCVDMGSAAFRRRTLAQLRAGSALAALRGHFVDPLRLSAVVLSGANERSGARASSDSMLSGREVARMDLRGTELVVLSACETGLGEQEAGEGSIGLARSFLLAGADHVITSLWQVPSRQTAALFVDFYGAAFGRSPRHPAAALHAARLRRIAALRKRGLPHNAWFWAAFQPLSGGL